MVTARISRTAAPAHGHLGETVDEVRVDAGERRGIGRHLEPLEAGEDRFEHQLGLEPREVRAQAEVRATGAERDVVVGIAA